MLFLILFVSLGFSIIYIYYWNQQFLLCPNKEMLLWDANIRMIQSIDFLQYLKEGNFLESLKIILDSPTWPPLRNLMSIGFILINGSPDPILDTRISLFFFIFLVFILPISIYFIYLKNFTNFLDKTIGYLSIILTILTLLLLKQLPEYLFSSMLEIQGMFVYFLFIAYFIYLEKNQLYSLKRSKLIFFILGALVYLTKYPYGVLISLTLILLELIKDPINFLREIAKILKDYLNFRIIFIVLILLSFIFVIIYPHLPNEFLKRKFPKNLIYFSILIFFVEFNFYLIQSKKAFFSDSLRFFYKFFIFPFAILILSHLDRFRSLLGAQSDTIDKDRNFFTSLFLEYFENPYTFTFSILFSLIAILYWVWKNNYNFSKALKKSTILQIIFFVWIHFIILEFTTTNHQARYIFQILPPLILFHFLVFTKIEQKTVKKTIGILFSFLVLIHIYVLNKNLYTRNVCFAGTDPEIFKPVYFIKKEISESTRGILFNEFHEYKKSSINLENPYLFIPTDIDVHLRYKVFNHGFLINSNQKIPSYSSIDTLIYITYSCKNKVDQSIFYKDFFTRHSLTFKLESVKEINSFICLKLYTLSKEKMISAID
ncbi:MAG: hypothetical protein ACK4UJ_00835 [Leptonema sp. (in: bacteria)]